EEEPAGVVGGGLDDLRVPEGLDDGPDDEGVEEPEEADGDVGGARNGPLRVTCLAAVDDGGLEPGEGGEGAGEDGGHAGDEDVPCGEGSKRKPFGGAAFQQHPAREQHENPGLGDEQNAQDLGTEVDGAEAAVPDE